MNAILNKNNSNLLGASIYVSMYPCNECAKLIIQAGVTRVVFFTGKLGDGKVDASYRASNKMFQLAGVEVCQHQPDLAAVGQLFMQL
jgi:dCMP deaminase